MLVPLLLRKSQNDVLLLLSFSFMGQLLQKGDGLHRTLYIQPEIRCSARTQFRRSGLSDESNVAD
jgi:hypothetical protein